MYDSRIQLPAHTRFYLDNSRKFSRIRAHTRTFPCIFAHARAHSRIYTRAQAHTQAYSHTSVFYLRILAHTRGYPAAQSAVALSPYSLSIELLLTFLSTSTGRASSRGVLPGINDAETSALLPKRSTSRAISLPSSACRVGQGPRHADHALRDAAVHDSG